MPRVPVAIAAVLATAIGATAVTAGGHGGNPAVKARQAHMQMYMFNAGLLFGMARGNVEYDAASAQAAASNLAALASLDQSRYWPQGTDNATIQNTRALPAIWENIPDVIAKAKALGTAATALEAAAGTDLATMQAALGPVGQACGACHESYRQPDN